jgi:hypothetical protein
MLRPTLIKILKNNETGLNLNEIAEQLNCPADMAHILKCLNEGVDENVFELAATPLCERGVKYKLKEPDYRKN